MNIKKIIQILINILIIIGCAAYLPSVVGYNDGIAAIWSLFGISAIVLALLQLLPIKSKKRPLSAEEVKVWSQIHLLYFWLATCILFAGVFFTYGLRVQEEWKRNMPIVLWLIPLIPSFLMWVRINAQPKAILEQAKYKPFRITVVLLLFPFLVASFLFISILFAMGQA